MKKQKQRFDNRFPFDPRFIFFGINDQKPNPRPFGKAKGSRRAMQNCNMMACRKGFPNARKHEGKVFAYAQMHALGKM